MVKKSQIKPDASHTESDGVYTFTAWDLVIVADNLKDAKKHALDFHAIDVDKDIPPFMEDVKELTEKNDKQ